MERHGISRETVRTFLADEGGGFGLGPDALSGYTAYAFDGLGAFEEDSTQMFPDGKYPPNTLLIIDRLVKEEFLIEVQTIDAV